MINVEHLDYSYKKKQVFNDLNISFQQGYVYGLLGKNGTGKTTLFRTICGLLEPRKGEVKVFGYEARSRKPDMLRNLFLLPEEFFVPAISVKSFVATLAPFYPKFSKEDFESYLSVFDITQNGRLDEMSLGQKKKSLIAFSLATNTSLLLLDEPTNGLDIVSKTQFKEVIKRRSNGDSCVIISTHQVHDIEQLVNRIAVIDNGQILFDKELQAVAAKLYFDTNLTDINADDIVYFEKTLNGNAAMLRNKEHRSSNVDLELLYKAVMLKTSELQQIFAHE